jgi:hypothetical protein
MKVMRFTLGLVITLIITSCYSVAFSQTTEEKYLENFGAKTKYINFSSFTVGIGSDNKTIGFKIINSVISPNGMALGLGFGAEKFSHDSVVPVFIDIRPFPDFTNNRIIYVFLDPGFAFSTASIPQKYDRDGLYFNGGVGFILAGYSKVGITLDLGYKIQFYEGSSHEGFLTAGLGFSFTKVDSQSKPKS